MSGAYEEWLYELPGRLAVMSENEKRCGRDGSAEDLATAADEIERLRSEVAKFRAKEDALIRLIHDPECA